MAIGTTLKQPLNTSRQTQRHKPMQTEHLFPNATDLDRAANILLAGGLVAFATETVYGLGGDARNDHAVARIFAAKGRPRFNPLIVHVANLDQARRYGAFDARAMAVAAAFWPGPLTLVVPLRPDSGLSPLVTAELPSVAIRVPAHPVAQALLTAFGGPLAAPSANRSGRISPTRAAHVFDGLSGKIDAVLEGGTCSVGVESTILGLLGAPELLRPGGIDIETLEAMLGPLQTGGSAIKPSAPGQLASHYAPNASVTLNVTFNTAGAVHLGFGPDSPNCRSSLNLSPGADLIETAANLFHMLREADLLAGPDGAITVAPIPENGLGRAINDRLRRAAAPRYL
jgi:L-threonylcarbamoyladenylate synthase